VGLVAHRVDRQLEEQRAVDHPGVEHSRPESEQQLPGIPARLDRGRDLNEQLALPGLDDSGDGGQKTFPRAEVVDHHPVAGPDRGRDRSQAAVLDALRGEVLDRRREHAACLGGRHGDDGRTTHPCRSVDAATQPTSSGFVGA
jgi:hypothetical protein